MLFTGYYRDDNIVLLPYPRIYNVIIDAKTFLLPTMTNMKEGKFAEGDVLTRKAVSIFVVSVLVLTAIGFTYKFVSERDTNIISTSEIADRPDAGKKPTMISGLLGVEEPIILQDGSTLSTLVESPDQGLLEVGVIITGPRASTVTVTDIVLIGSTGSEFRATELNRVDTGISFTINASLEADERVTLVWFENKEKLVELS